VLSGAREGADRLAYGRAELVQEPLLVVQVERSRRRRARKRNEGVWREAARLSSITPHGSAERAARSPARKSAAHDDVLLFGRSNRRPIVVLVTREPRGSFDVSIRDGTQPRNAFGNFVRWRLSLYSCSR